SQMATFVSVTEAWLKPDQIRSAEEEVRKLASQFDRLDGFLGAEQLRSTKDPAHRLWLLKWRDRAAWERYHQSDLHQKQARSFFDRYFERFEDLGHWAVVEWATTA